MSRWLEASLRQDLRDLRYNGDACKGLDPLLDLGHSGRPRIDRMHFQRIWGTIGPDACKWVIRALRARDPRARCDFPLIAVRR